MKIEKVINPNYCATVVKLEKFVPIQGADKIQHTLIFSNSVIVNKEVLEGTIGIFFPLECQISSDLLKSHNSFRNKDLNSDTSKVGFFESTGRVRAVRLRGQKSEGYFLPFDGLTEEYSFLKELPVGQEFDIVNDKIICQKFVVISRQQSLGSPKNKQGKSPKGFDRLVDDQFRLHIDTVNAKKNFIGNILPDDLISISEKLHGTSAVFAHVIVKRKLNFVERMLQTIGIKIQDTEYGNVYSSRKVVKNQFESIKDVGFYGSDVWGQFNEKIKDQIPKGISLYGEIVGYVPGSDSMIQKGYHYGEHVGSAKLYIYRITFTNPDGKVFEFNWSQIKDFCMRYWTFDHVPEFFYGKAKDIFPEIEVNEDWGAKVLEKLMTSFNLEQMCELNRKEVPAEGIVIRKEKLYDCDPMKLKSFKFLEWETKILDSGESDIESDN